MMTEEQILELATYHFYDDGEEWWGSRKSIIEFAQKIYQMGYDEGCND